MAGLIGKATRKVEGISRATENERRDASHILPGRIVSFDSKSQEAIIEPMFKPTVNGEPIDPPALERVPVNQTRGGGFSMTVPMLPGDPVELTFDDVDTSEWYLTGEKSPARTKRLNSLSDAKATPGRVPVPDHLVNFDPVNLHVGTEDGKSGLRVTPGGLVAIEGPKGTEELLTIVSELLGVLLGETTTVKFGSSMGDHPLTNQSEYEALKARLDRMKLR